MFIGEPPLKTPLASIWSHLFGPVYIGSWRVWRDDVIEPLFWRVFLAAVAVALYWIFLKI